MNRKMKRAMLAALPATLASNAYAQEVVTPSETTGDETIVVSPVTLHPAAGLMNEHTHDGGEFMLGLRYSHSHHSGLNQSGTSTIADADILATGYTVRATEMTMDMVMLDIMYAPNDKLTLMVMPHWMRHEMTMVGIDPANTGMAGMTNGLPFAHTMSHASEGFGDTLVSASYRLIHTPRIKAHATLGLWTPTGKIDRRNPNGTYAHYMMQSGSGTWDLEPMITVTGQTGMFGWGAQAGYRWRTSDANDSGFAFGDRASASGWLSYLVDNGVSLTSRVSWEQEGKIIGEYNEPHSLHTPADRPENYGGTKVFAGLGANVAIPVGGRNRPQLGFEAGLPIHQNLNGIQLAEDWRASFSLSQTF